MSLMFFEDLPENHVNLQHKFKTMKKIMIFGSLLLALTALISCEGPEGPRGAQGPTGPAGQNGNEEVYLFTYGSRTLDAFSSYFTQYTFDTLSSQTLSESVILVYYSQFPQEWNMANGFGPAALYATVQYYAEYSETLSVYLRNVDGTPYSGADVTWDSTKIYIIPPAMIRLAEEQNTDLGKIENIENLTGLK